MKTFYEFRQANNHLLSRSSFLKKEVDFLFRLIEKEYNRSPNSARCNILDSFREMLEHAVSRINHLNNSIRFNELKPGENYDGMNGNLHHIEFQERKNRDMIRKITNEIRIVKESLTEFTRSHGSQGAG